MKFFFFLCIENLYKSLFIIDHYFFSEKCSLKLISLHLRRIFLSNDAFVFGVNEAEIYYRLMDGYIWIGTVLLYAIA